MKKEMLPWYASAAILFIFTIRYILTGNYEFLVYSVTLGVLIWALMWTDKKFFYNSPTKWGFVAWIIMHLSGGSFKVNGTRLYDLILIPLAGEPYYIFRYDQLVHAVCYIVITLIIYTIIKESVKKDISVRRVAFIAFFAGLGVGALNEIIEFSTVVFFNAGAAVGTYTNNALDLVFNALGALIAVLIGKKAR